MYTDPSTLLDELSCVAPYKFVANLLYPSYRLL